MLMGPGNRLVRIDRLSDTQDNFRIEGYYNLLDIPAILRRREADIADEHRN
jgi:hypothetical protein